MQSIMYSKFAVTYTHEHKDLSNILALTGIYLVNIWQMKMPVGTEMV